MKNELNEFINYLKVEKNCSIKTLRSYRCDIEQFFSEMNLSSTSDINKQAIRSFLSLLVDKKSEPSTRNRKLTAIRSFCKFLCMEEYLDKNPAIDISYAKIDKRLPKVMSISDTGQLIDSVEDPRNRAAMETLYGTGCRVEELVGIKVNHIDFNDSTVLLFGKGGKERKVPISVSALVSIVDYLGARKDKSEYLFPSPTTGRALTTKAMYNMVSKHGRENGTPTSPHKFRHSIATHLLSNGMDIRKIQEFLGHENINTTTIYAQVAIEQMAKEFHYAHPRG